MNTTKLNKNAQLFLIFLHFSSHKGFPSTKSGRGCLIHIPARLEILLFLWPLFYLIANFLPDWM